MLYSVLAKPKSRSNGIIGYLHASYHGFHLTRVIQIVQTKGLDPYLVEQVVNAIQGKPTLWERDGWGARLACEMLLDQTAATARAYTCDPQQLAVSLILATSDGNLDAPRNLDREAAKFTKTKLLDPRSDRYQTSTGEALFLSNNPEVYEQLLAWWA